MDDALPGAGTLPGLPGRIEPAGPQFSSRGRPMGTMPDDPLAFSQRVAGMLRRFQPELGVEMTGPGELIIDGRRLDLENLYRIVRHEPARGEEIVEHYLDQLFSEEGVDLSSITYDFARPRLMPRIQPASIFEHLSRELVAHTPFVNDTVIVYVVDLPQMTVSVTTEQMIRWGVPLEELEAQARANLDEYAPELEIQIVESREGGRAAIVSEQDGYDAARLLLSGLFLRLAPRLGGDFLVATPARDMFVAMSRAPGDFVDRLRDRVRTDFDRLPYPITQRLFYVTRDGVAGTIAEAA